VRSDFPSQPIKLYGPGTDSGTFDYFTEVVVGTAKSSRPDYQASEDDNVLVQGVAGDQYSLGYFGHAYVKENTDKVKPIGVDGGAGCVEPTDATITNKTYTPLSRPLFLYVKKAALARPEVKAFVKYYMDDAAALVPSTGYLALDAGQYQQNVQALEGGAMAAPAPSDSAAAAPK
jgi:phosphate transport system substrate-binding protein